MRHFGPPTLLLLVVLLPVTHEVDGVLVVEGGEYVLMLEVLVIQVQFVVIHVEVDVSVCPSDVTVEPGYVDVEVIVVVAGGPKPDILVLVIVVATVEEFVRVSVTAEPG